MSEPLISLTTWLLTKPDPDAVVLKCSSDPQLVSSLLDLIESDKGTLKFQADKLIQGLSVTHPDLILPVHDRIASHINSSNSFIQWGAMITLANLIPFDEGKAFMKVLPEFKKWVQADSMITAANASKGLVALIRCHREYEAELIPLLISCEDRTYLYHGEPSPECRSIMIGHVLDFFLDLIDGSNVKEMMVGFATRHVEDPRNKTAKKAEAFLDRVLI